jgi:CRP-like cAMP-binding protein
VAAWEGSPLRRILNVAADQIFVDARERVVPSGNVLFEMSEPGTPLLALVVDGMLRVYAMSPNGRQATVRYTAIGDVVGLPLFLAPDAAAHPELAVQAVTATTLVHLSPRTLRSAVQANPDCMWALFSELARSFLAGHNLLSQNVFQPVRMRVARHLLDLAEKRGDRLFVTASQQDIADAIGSVREVVSRVIIQFRDEGLLRRHDGGYLICEPRGLHAAALPPDEPLDRIHQDMVQKAVRPPVQ